MPVRARADPELMPIHHPIPGLPPLKWECEAQIETQDIDDVASDYSQDTQDDTLRLPLEILAIIAEYLTLSSSHATCASLAVTSHAVSRETTPVLWRTVTAWNPPRFPNGDTAEDGALVREMRDRWSELVNADAAKYIEYILVPPFAFDQEHKTFFQQDDYPFTTTHNHIFPRLKALTCFTEFIGGPRLMLSQPYLYICAGFRPGTGDVEGVLRLLSLVPGVLGKTLVRPPWNFVVQESTTTTWVSERVAGGLEVEEEDEGDEWEDVDDDDEDFDDDLQYEDDDIQDENTPIDEQSLLETDTYTVFASDELDTQYAPLVSSDLSKTVHSRLTDCFPYPLTIIEFATPLLDRPDKDLVAAIFIDLLRLVVSLPRGMVAMMVSVRGLRMDEVIGCIESYQPLLLLHPEYAFLKLEFQIIDTEDDPPFTESVDRIFRDIRAALFAISCRGTPLDAMGSFAIARKEGEEVGGRWRMRVLEGERKVVWGLVGGGAESEEAFPGEGEDAYALLRDQYASNLWGDADG